MESRIPAAAAQQQPTEKSQGGSGNLDSFQQKAMNDIARPAPQQQQDLQSSTSEMFTKVSKYLGSELSATVADYNLLVQMNSVTASKYKDMTDMTKGLTLYMNDLKLKYEEFLPYLEKIDDLDKNVGDLEKTVQLIDEYTKRLESKIKNIDKSALSPIKIQPPTPVTPPTFNNNPIPPPASTTTATTTSNTASTTTTTDTNATATTSTTTTNTQSS
ncbi:biogenesis of lysosome-related organelles complex-1 [Heterostelium album PN500]|uniref:Biogenesis of lysosome-related organelles complex-1 n=1 Tax=Heterostelium pallidum (strain ATCC 26659 / Pp 5 / PN500) TaxID=670386 RepID=D3BLY6_HETP5|nr:biogenesis of lysosome-related organelles complex-1 [Heterostelium album PN500]EFA77587.1 biogenesis of lysosome-related organelles complex-1 [Heterostelium album PN500]|eukprot:XP_020429715.1 biogenesis of lysosome-related organelles complex-1 [Heterostelium album PN500]